MVARDSCFGEAALHRGKLDNDLVMTVRGAAHDGG